MKVGLSADGLRVVALPRDRSGFVRRRCGACRRHFKTRPGAQDGLAVQRFLAKQLKHQDADVPDAVEHSRCPYCGTAGAAEAWLTAGQRAHIAKLARGLEDHVQHAQMLQAGYTLDPTARPTFLPVTPEPLPFSLGTEPEDLRSVHLVCCDLDVKVQPDWDGPLHCPECGVRHGWPTHAVRVSLLRE
ncbi:MAG: hypothetical protein L0Y64_06100 [Myxococcaceae bacterium]|nr:hypothetical protein [Myxococcaceae bacterium]